MIGGRRPEPMPGHGSGTSIGGNNNAPVQNVVGQNISHVHQSASVRGTTDVEAVRGLLVAFRADLDRHRGAVATEPALRGMTDAIDHQLALPAPETNALRQMARTLPALVLGTVVQQGGEALADALTGWLG